ncbi:hypothetical protein DFP73DRAFT_589935 [Morchella snyderi]|nr:hypothetical protein DFP73DRAFT_589935 [Morchella snyderi]
MHYLTLLLTLMAGSALAAFSFNTAVTEGLTFDGSLPTNGVSSACKTAYSASIDCDASFLQLRDSTEGPSLFTKAGLDKVCTTACIDSLNAWDRKLHQECTDQDKLFADEQDLVYLSTALGGTYLIQENLYWPFCLSDSTTGTFCLIDTSLPEWPTLAATNDPSAVDAFCGSDCRMQESFLMNLYYNDYDLVDAEAVCPGLNISSLPMSVNMETAFGSVPSSQEGVVGNNTGGKILGGDYSWEFLMKGAMDANSAGSAAGSTAESSAGGGEAKGVAMKAEVSGVLFLLAVAGASALLV